MKSSETTAKENKIRDTLSFLNEEEAILSLYETEEKMLRFFVYPMGEGMAEVTAQDMGLLSRNQKIEEMSGKITEKMTKYIIKVFEVLEQAGFSEVTFVERKGTNFEQILRSTEVVQKIYSEFMMKSPKKRATTTSSCVDKTEKMKYSEDEGGYVCRNKDGSFFARVSSYQDGWYVYEVEVSYDKRRIGIGTECMRNLMERFPQLYLQVGSYNEAAMGLYRKLGFEVIEELCYYA